MLPQSGPSAMWSPPSPPAVHVYTHCVSKLKAIFTIPHNVMCVAYFQCHGSRRIEKIGGASASGSFTAECLAVRSRVGWLWSSSGCLCYDAGAPFAVVFATDALQVFELAGRELRGRQRLPPLLHGRAEVVANLGLAQQLLKHLHGTTIGNVSRIAVATSTNNYR